MAQFTIFITFSITCPPKGSIGINTQQQQKAEVEELTCDSIVFGRA